MCGIRLTVSPVYSKILSKFPQKLSFCFAYGSGVKLQLQNVKPSMVDFVYCVENADKWHEENLKINSNHYSFLKLFGHKVISRFQENSGAKVYFNTLVNIDNILIKYGVISRKDLITDLLEWSDLYLAGRLHKPVEIVRKTTNAELQTALQLNLQSAVHAALLLLPESFTEYDFYHTISNLSYSGDFRMIFGENKNKVSNIVKPQLNAFRNLYKPLVKSLHDYVEFPAVALEENNIKLQNYEISKENHLHSVKEFLNSEYGLCCKQDVSPLAKLHHLNQLPRWPQKAITRFWNRGTVAQDTEDVLRAIAYDPDCGTIVEQCINDIVWRSSVRQSLKGIVTAGVIKSIKYSNKMSFPLSDEESSDSDNGVRFKTANTRDKLNAPSSSTIFNITKYYKNENKPSLHNSCENKYDFNKTYHKESKTEGNSKQHCGKSKYKRKEDKSCSSKIPEKPKSLNNDRKNKECRSKDHFNYERNTNNELSPINKTCDYKFSITKNSYIQQLDLVKFGPPLPTNRTTVNEFNSEFIVEQKICDTKSNKTSSTSQVVKPQFMEFSKHKIPKVDTFKTVSISQNDSILVKNDNKYFGPLLPANMNAKKEIHDVIYATSKPYSPLHLKNKISESTETVVSKDLRNDNEKETDNLLISPHVSDLKSFQKYNKCEIKQVVIGPVIPDHLRINISECESNLSTTNQINANESLPEEFIIGPLPVEQCLNIQLEERALQMKLDLLNKPLEESTCREKWMLELPEIRTGTQVIGPRKFRVKDMPDLKDRSIWTDTVKDKMNKESATTMEAKLESNIKSLRDKDLIQEKIVEKQKKNNKRCKSLVDLHHEELQKKKLKDMSVKNERRPFSRDIDLKTNRFDDAHTKTIIKKAHLLNNRFASGHSKFL